MLCVIKRRQQNYFQQLITATSQVMHVQLKEKGWFHIHTLLDMIKSLGVHSESEKFDIWRNKERRGSMLFLRGDDFCSAAASGRNIKLDSIAWLWC